MIAVCVAVGASSSPAIARRTTGTSAAVAATSPITNVVVIYQENHTFDNVLGRLCVADNRCDGVTEGHLTGGVTRPLATATDIVPNVAHSTKVQQAAINGGLMDGWAKVTGCSSGTNYQCLSQFDPSQVPNLSALARAFVISDRTFEMDRVLSFGAHVELVSTKLDGFDGSIPKSVGYAPKGDGGWGCDANKVTGWRATPSSALIQVPSCVPLTTGAGTFWDRFGPNGSPQTSPVPYMPNLFDRLDEKSATWKVYDTLRGFDLCSYFATCAHSSQHSNVLKSHAVIDDATAGRLPNVSFVMPDAYGGGGNASQHNGNSMIAGDNWIGDVVDAVERSPQWKSTAIFITYDDCGCFYDHVPPPNSQLGIRVPMVIVSPFAKAKYTDHGVASFVGMISFIEHNFGLTSLSDVDGQSYDYANSFDFSQTPLAGIPMVHSAMPSASAAVMRSQPADDDDPT